MADWVTLINCTPSRADHGGVTSYGGADAIHVYHEVVATTAVVMLSLSTSDQSPKFELDLMAEWVTLINCAPSRVGHGGVTSCGGDDTIHVYREVVATAAVVTLSLSTLDQSPKF